MNKTIWYMSYISVDKIGSGYINRIKELNSDVKEDNRKFVITMTYITDNINKLPKK
jgi:hypothetical protein